MLLYIPETRCSRISCHHSPSNLNGQTGGLFSNALIKIYNVLALAGPFVICHFKDKRLNLYHNNEIISLLYQKKYIFASEKLKIFVGKKLRIFACKNNFLSVQYTNNLNNEVIAQSLGFKMTYHIWF